MKTLRSLYSCIFFAFLFLFPFSHSSAEDFSDKYYRLREREIRSFALTLFEGGEYYRSITEAKRYIFLFSDGKDVSEMYEFIGDSYLMAQEWEDGANAYEEFLKKFPNSPRKNNALFSKAVCLVKLKKFKEAEDTFQEIIDSDLADKKREALLWKIVLLIRENKFEEVEKALGVEADKKKISIDAPAVRRITNLKREREYKSPKQAAFMSALLPGSGQAYVGRYKDAAHSFILNALFIAGAIWACDDGNYALGGILILFEAGWYTGNIYGAANAAHKYNRKIDDDVRKISTHTFGLDEYEIRKTPKASIIFRF